jgi:hypothetical protein
MGIIGRRKKSELPDDKDLEVLESSVNQLSQQTSALLSHFGEGKQKKLGTEKNTKNTKKINTSKKQVAKSFDIITSPGKSTKLKAKLKTAETTHKVELLPEHATDSYNEKPSSDSAVAAVDQKTQSRNKDTDQLPSIQSNHTTGSLNMNMPTEQESIELDIVTSEKTGTNNDNLDKLEAQKKVSTESVRAEQTLKFEDNKADGGKAPEEAKEVVAQSSDTSKNESLNGITSSIANNIQPEAGYKAPDSQQKPTVFDTNEYHVELHDWSKLEYKSNTLWYLLGLLFAIFAAGIFFIVSGFSVPFIG